MDNNEVYAIDKYSYYGDYPIIKCELIKETEKMYIISRGGSEWHIKKSEMASQYYVYVLGYSNAVNTRLEFINDEIMANNKQIAKLSARNAKLQGLLKPE